MLFCRDNWVSIIRENVILGKKKYIISCYLGKQKILFLFYLLLSPYQQHVSTVHFLEVFYSDKRDVRIEQDLTYQRAPPSVSYNLVIQFFKHEPPLSFSSLQSNFISKDFYFKRPSFVSFTIVKTCPTCSHVNILLEKFFLKLRFTHPTQSIKGPHCKDKMPKI